jgi:mannose PTS system EIID component
MHRWLKRGALIFAAVVPVVLLLAMLPAPVLADSTSTPAIKVSLGAAILIGLGYYLSYSPWLGCMFGYFSLYRPLVAGLFVGLILGDPGQGTLIGAAINLAYLGFISAGGSMPGDPGLAGWLGTALALAGNFSYGQALALAVPIGLLGTIIWNTTMTVDSVFVHWADRFADRGDMRGVALMNWVPSQIFLFLITFFPCLIAAYSGVDVVVNVLNDMPSWFLNGLAVAGGVFAAIGIAMNMRFIFRGAVIPYFFIGYFIMVATGQTISLVVLAVIGLALAYLHVTFVATWAPRGGTGAAVPAAAPAVAEAKTAGTLRLTRGDIVHSWLNWWFLIQANYNYERLQGNGFAHTMIPVIKRLYHTPEDITAALKRHLTFFNTEPGWGSVVPGIVIAMEEERANGANIDDDAINSVKTGLMGPIAGIGDTIDQGTITPILLALGIGIAGVSVAGGQVSATTGNPLGVIIYLILQLAATVAISYVLFTQGYHRGRTFVTDILRSGLMDKVVLGARVLGNLVLGALAAKFIVLFLAPTIKITGTSLNIQADVLDKILPGLLPLALVLTAWYLLRRRVSPILLLVIFLIAALVGSFPLFGPAPQTTNGDNCGSAIFSPYTPCAAPAAAADVTPAPTEAPAPAASASPAP